MNRTSLKDLSDCIFDSEKENALLTWIWLGFLLITGLILWGYFLNFGDIPFDYHDWAEVNAPRIAFLKDAVTKGALPLHMPDTSALRGVTDRFMALPDVILSPQIILLKWLSVGDFILVHTWLLFSIGFLGLFAIKKHFHLSLFSFTWLFFLFFFNGHILSHYSVGHVTWGGYFLFSWFIWLVFCLLDGEKSWTWVGRTAFLLFFIFLQGSFHQFVWCVIFLAILAVTKFSVLIPILKAGILACLLSAIRMIPPALQMGAFDDDFLGGYGTPLVMAKALMRIISPADSLNAEKTGAVLGWWEFDMYVGIAGTVFLIFFGIQWLLQRKKEHGFPVLIFPLAALVFFSIRNFYQIIRFTQIPLFSGERVSARFLILPVVFLIVMACTALQNNLQIRKFHRLKILLSSLLLVILIMELWNHISAWKVLNSVKAFPYTYTNLAIKVVSNHDDPLYTNGLIIGALISGISLAGWIWLYWREKKQTAVKSGNEHTENDSTD